MAWKLDPKCSGLNRPVFEDDPTAYFDWFDDCASGDVELPEPPEPPCRPSRGTLSSGRCWEIICTSDGPEIRPCFDRPLPPTPALQIIALRLTGNGYFAQIATKRGLVVRKLANGQVKLAQLASAMLNQSKLPATDIRKIPTAFWAKQKKIVVKRSRGKY